MKVQTAVPLVHGHDSWETENKNKCIWSSYRVKLLQMLYYLELAKFDQTKDHIIQKMYQGAQRSDYAGLLQFLLDSENHLLFGSCIPWRDDLWSTGICEVPFITNWWRHIPEMVIFDWWVDIWKQKSSQFHCAQGKSRTTYWDKESERDCGIYLVEYCCCYICEGDGVIGGKSRNAVHNDMTYTKENDALTARFYSRREDWSSRQAE